MDQVQFRNLLPLISIDLVSYIVEMEHISGEEAIKELYSSKLYEALEEEETKVWQYSTPMLYTLFLQEKQIGNIEYPDV